MSVVAYSKQQEAMYADSICVDGYHRMLAQKAFRYTSHIRRSPDGEVTVEHGSAGFVGDPSIGFALISAYMDGGVMTFEKCRRELLETMPDKEDRQSGDILIVPDDGPYMWLTAGMSRPLFPVPKQDLIIGAAQITSRVWMAFDETGDMASSIARAIRSSKGRDDSHLVCAPIITLTRGEDTSPIQFGHLRY